MGVAVQPQRKCLRAKGRMRSADRLAPSDWRKKCGSTREDRKEKRLGSWCGPDDGAPEAGTPAACLGNLGPKGKRGLDWWLGVQRALLSPTARARPQNPCGNSSSRGRREPGLKKSRGGTQGLTANRVPVGWEMGGCLIKDRGGQASRENHSQSSHLDWHPKNDARAPVQPRRDPHLPKPCWAELISHRKQSEVVSVPLWWWLPGRSPVSEGAWHPAPPSVTGAVVG